jgi:hypothetical protein
MAGPARISLPGGLRVWRGWWLARGAHRLNSPLGRKDHTALTGLVADAAKRAGCDIPEQVGLGGAATVTALPGRLIVGLPLVWGLSADELGAVVAHELALPATRYPGITRTLVRRAADEPLTRAVEQVRDAAAIDAAGGGLAAVEDAARALFRAAAVHAAFSAFLGTWGSPRIAAEPTPEPVRLADLHEGWHVWLHTGAAVVPPGAAGWSPEAPAAEHPGLAEELLDLAAAASAGPVAVGADPAAVPLDELTPAELRDLAADVSGASGAWRRFAELPPAVYLEPVEQAARRQMAAVEAVLGGVPADRAELVDVLLHRAAAVDRAAGDTRPGADRLTALVAYTLLKKGFRRVHPVDPGRLVGPAGEPVDLGALRDRPAALRRLLIDGPSAA